MAVGIHEGAEVDRAATPGERGVEHPMAIRLLVARGKACDEAVTHVLDALRRHLPQERGEITIAENQRHGGEAAGACFKGCELHRVTRAQSARLLQREGNSLLQQERRLFHHVAMTPQRDDEIRPRLAAQRAEIGVARTAEPRRQGCDEGGVRVANTYHLHAIDLQSRFEIERKVPMRGSNEDEFHGPTSNGETQCTLG